MDCQEVHEEIRSKMAQATRSQVLQMYRRILRLSRTWVAKDPNQTKIERNYIGEETARLFKLNKGLTAPSDIIERLREAEARLAMAVHYRNPYPRPVNLPPKSFSNREGKKTGRAIEKLNQMSKPIYIKSISDDAK